MTLDREDKIVTVLLERRQFLDPTVRLPPVERQATELPATGVVPKQGDKCPPGLSGA